MRDFQQTENRIRRSVVSAATELGIKASFADGRRDSDILVIRLRGNRKDTVFLSQQLKEIFPTVDIDVLQGKQHDGNVLTMIVTKPLTEQEAQEAMERRSKLRSKAQRNKRASANALQNSNAKPQQKSVKASPDKTVVRERKAHEEAMERIPQEEQPVGYDYRKSIN